MPLVKRFKASRPVNRPSTRRPHVILALLTATLVVAGSQAQQAPATLPAPARTPPGSGPGTLTSGDRILNGSAGPLRVRSIKGLERPWALAFLPSGDMLVTERPGRLRIVRRDLVLDPEPVRGVPAVLNAAYKGLMDIALHPRFSDNRLVYFTYWKPRPGEPREANWDSLMGASGAATLARGRYDGGHVLTDVRDLFVSNAWTSGASASRLAFGRDGTIFMGIGAPNRDVAHGGTARVGTSEEAQDPGSHTGKILRLNDDGSVPNDNPFVGRAGYRPEIYALGIRNPLGLIVHPQTGALWEADHGPMGGDEVNIITAGANLGWPVVSLGRAYNGEATGAGFGPEQIEPCAVGMTQPFIHWTPNIAPGGMVIYTGSRFPDWRGHLLLGGLSSTQLHRVQLNARGLPQNRESLLTELKQRIREVREGPDGALYLLTDHDDGALLVVEPGDPR
jgi:glucose/arabinose dehydrogenase